MAATQCTQSRRHGQEGQLLFRPNTRTGIKCNLIDFDRGMTVGARQLGLSISKTADLLEFSCRAVSSLYKEFSTWQFCGKKHFVNERGQRRMATLVEADRKVTITAKQQ